MSISNKKVQSWFNTCIHLFYKKKLKTDSYLHVLLVVLGKQIIGLQV